MKELAAAGKVQVQQGGAQGEGGVGKLCGRGAAALLVKTAGQAWRGARHGAAAAPRCARTVEGARGEARCTRCRAGLARARPRTDRLNHDARSASRVSCRLSACQKCSRSCRGGWVDGRRTGGVSGWRSEEAQRLRVCSPRAPPSPQARPRAQPSPCTPRRSLGHSDHVATTSPPRFVHLRSPVPAQPPRQLHVLDKHGHPLGVDGAQLRWGGEGEGREGRGRGGTRGRRGRSEGQGHAAGVVGAQLWWAGGSGRQSGAAERALTRRRRMGSGPLSNPWSASSSSNSSSPPLTATAPTLAMLPSVPTHHPAPTNPAPTNLRILHQSHQVGLRRLLQRQNALHRATRAGECLVRRRWHPRRPAAPATGGARDSQAWTARLAAAHRPGDAGLPPPNCARACTLQRSCSPISPRISRESLQKGALGIRRRVASLPLRWYWRISLRRGGAAGGGRGWGGARSEV